MSGDESSHCLTFFVSYNLSIRKFLQFCKEANTCICQLLVALGEFEEKNKGQSIIDRMQLIGACFFRCGDVSIKVTDKKQIVKGGIGYIRN